jgi:tetratricopeptide (TPR) repeat protein
MLRPEFYKGCSIELHTAYAYGHCRLGDLSEAEASLKKAVEVNPYSAPAQFALGQFYLIHDRLSAAWVHMRKAADLAPTDPWYLNGLGKILLREGNPSEAASYLLTAIKITPGFEEALQFGGITGLEGSSGWGKRRWSDGKLQPHSLGHFSQIGQRSEHFHSPAQSTTGESTTWGCWKSGYGRWCFRAE